MLFPVELPTGDESGLEDVGTIALNWGRKVRVKDIQMEKTILLKLAEDGNISEYLSIGHGWKNIK